ncbi:hypothetical protein DIS01_05120 [Vibrio cholerae]|nr:hypothetical protein DIS01_05120 [Vibrio cholerae]
MLLAAAAVLARFLHSNHSDCLCALDVLTCRLPVTPHSLVYIGLILKDFEDNSRDEMGGIIQRSRRDSVCPIGLGTRSSSSSRQTT